jgi:molybdopterin-containing oxidoreductase family iron-sulfur binding subunit
VPRYRFDQADVVVSFGADFLGNWLSGEEHSGDWAKLRKLASAKAASARLSKTYCFESAFTVTGANADERFAVRAGDELKAALAVAHELIVVSKQSRYAGDSAVEAALASYKPEAVAQELGITGGAATFKRIAHDLWQARGKSLVVGGGIHAQTKTGLALQVAINLLNSALENEGVTVDGRANHSPSRGNVASFAKLLQDMGAGKVDALVIWGTNPAYFLPNSGFAAASAKVPFIVAIADREDETAQLADFVLADHHYLEAWGDASPRAGLYALQQPTISPIHDTRSFQDGLLAWLKKKEDFHEYLKAHWRDTLYRQNGSAGTFDQFWEGVLRAGVLVTRTPAFSARAFNGAALSQIPKYAATPADDVILALYANVALHDGKQANNAWLQELPEPISSVTWDNYLAMSAALAAKLSVKNDDVVEVKVGDVSVELPVYVQPGMHANSVAVAVGYGRRAVGKVGDGCGVDVYPFVQLENGRTVFSGQTAQLRKTGRFYRLAATQWHTVTENRPIINDITLTEFKKNPGVSNHTDPHLRLETVPTMWPKHEYKDYRWGMAIDLNSCLGCGACTIACQAENNIPVVGRDQVRVSRQMHWIRIDRYYSGSAENPEVIFQPMLCQHCENASCETVCPVLATVHDGEGLNVQVYNRCVGTRYCQNNCPYKVRRFNFFDHWKSYDTTMNMAWNPDVTVRTRGIMEKCSFCVQRIRDGKDHAKDAGERVKDGDIKTACQQTCSTDAIVFGDVNDPESRVSKLREDPRAFRALEILNNVPMISYMTKVRNVERAGAHHAGLSQAPDGAVAMGLSNEGGEHHG